MSKVVYAKSIVAGVLALVLVALLIPAIVIVEVVDILGPIGIGKEMPRWQLGSPLFWLFAIIIFSAGFLWEFRRLSK